MDCFNWSPRKKALGLLAGTWGLLAVAQVQAVPVSITDTFAVDFAASQSLWGGGPSAGFDESDRTSGSVGLYYSFRADTGTVDANVNGGIQAQYFDENRAGQLTNINLSFLGDANGSNLTSRFGMSAEAGVFLDISGCFGLVILGECAGIPFSIEEDIPVLDEGFFLEPDTGNYRGVIDQTRSARDADVAASAGGLDVVIGTLGPTINLDLDQTIYLNPTGLDGRLVYRNLHTGETGMRDFNIPTAATFGVGLDLDQGDWEFSILNLNLLNSFRNNIDVELRPAFDYIVGSWPPPGDGLFSVGLIDETFSLAFNSIAQVGSFRLQVVPEPGTLALFGIALFVLGSSTRKRTKA